MAISTYKIFLMHKSADSYSKLCDIKSFPSLMSAPEMIEVTTLSQGQRCYIPGIKGDSAGLEFQANYDLSVFQTLKALEDKEEDYAVWFGGTVAGETVTPTGTDGKFKFKGYLSVSPDGGNINEVVNMTITIAPTVPVTLDSAS